ncbi:MAG: PEP-CTERM sorting domain-containing protein [Verrucomicrobiota bacterium]
MNTKKKLPLLSVTASLMIIGNLSINAATLVQWSITATTERTNADVTNAFTGFTATDLTAAAGLQTVNPSISSTPTNTWRFTYTNSPYPIPTHGGLQAISVGDYIGFDTVVEAGWDVKVDGVLNFNIGKTATTAATAGLYFSTNNGTSWTQAGGNANLPSLLGSADYSTEVNTGTATNQYSGTYPFNTGAVTTTQGLATAPVEFDNTLGESAMTVKWALAFSNGGIGRIGIENGGNLLTLTGSATSVPEPSSYALVGLSACMLVYRRRR